MKKYILFFVLIILCIGLTSCAEQKASSTEFMLNTVINITAYGEKANEAIQAAFDDVKRIENLLSCHIETSEISKINAIAHKEKVEISEETLFVLKKALEMSQKTDGAFDISVKPLADLWNITAENPVIPSESEITKAKSCVGYENIVIDGNTIFFKKEGVQIDLGGAAKGYCADKVCQVLKHYGIKNALIDLGGNIYALGKNEKGQDWRIGLQAPKGVRGEYFEVENLSDKSAVTSGSYERYFEKEGKIYHHILDPKTGYSADTGLISVTVIGKNSFECDMLSTAIFVMGEENFNKISQNFDYEKYVTVDKLNTVRTYNK